MKLPCRTALVPMVVLATVELAGTAGAASAQTPETGRDRISGVVESLPPGSSIDALLFFEGEREPPPRKSRVYETKFPEQSRTIYWELRLSYPAASRSYTFDIKSVMFKDGQPLEEFGMENQAVERGWTNSWYSTGWGFGKNWAPGIYHVGIVIDDAVVVVKKFEVTASSASPK